MNMKDLLRRFREADAPDSRWRRLSKLLLNTTWSFFIAIVVFVLVDFTNTLVAEVALAVIVFVNVRAFLITAGSECKTRAENHDYRKNKTQNSFFHGFLLFL